MFILRHRLASEVLPVVQVILSAEGRAVADNIGNTIVVNDRPEIIEEIKTLLLSSDRQMPQIRVQMSFDSSGNRSGRILSTKHGKTRTSGKSRTTRENAFITVSSGSSGYIRMAREVPLTDQWISLCRRYRLSLLLKETRILETGMDVSPVAAGDQVIVTVTPRISWVENGRADSFRFVEAATRITVPRSQWVDIGAMSSTSGKNTDVLRTILSTSDIDEKNSVLMRIKADVN